jgi:hypothetical protein
MPQNEAPKSPLAVRVKTPPTVEMIDHTQNEEEGDRNEAEKSEAEAENKTAESTEFAVKKQKTSDSSEEEKDLKQEAEDVTNDENKAEVQETKAETETKLEPEIADYDNPLLVHVSNSLFKSEKIFTYFSNTNRSVKFSFSEKATKVCAIFLMYLTFTK